MNYKRKGHQPILQEQIYRNEDGSRLPVLVFPALNAAGFAQHCFTTRLGGVSDGYLGTLNLSFTRGDDPANVHENFRRVAAVFGKGEDSFVLSCQEHHTNVRRVGREDAGAGVIKPLPWTDVDGPRTSRALFWGRSLRTVFRSCSPIPCTARSARVIRAGAEASPAWAPSHCDECAKNSEQDRQMFFARSGRRSARSIMRLVRM